MTWNAIPTFTVGLDGPNGFASATLNQFGRDNVQYNRDTERMVTLDAEGPAAWNNGGISSYSDFGGTSYCQVQLRKRQADSFIVVRGGIGAFCSGAVPTTFRFGVNYSGGGVVPGDWDSRPFCFNQLNVSYDIPFWAGLFTLDAFGHAVGQPVGLYTLILRVKNVAGTGAINFNSNLSVHMEALEWSLD